MGVKNGPVGTPSLDAIVIGDTLMSASAAELNLLDGVSGLVQADFAKLADTNTTAAELNLLNSVSGLVKADFTKLAALTPAAADINSLLGIGAVGMVVAEKVTFTENTVNTTFTGTIVLPAGAYLLDLIIYAEALWNDGAAATMVVGDGDPDGMYTTIDLRATDLLADEQMRIGLTGGKEGADQDGGDATGDHLRSGFQATARSIIGVVSVTTKDGTTGITHMVAVYVVPTNTAATASGT